MSNVDIREELHQYIDSADQEKVNAIYTMVKDDIAGHSFLTEAQKRELDFRLEEYMQGKGQNYSLEEALHKIKNR